MRKIKRCFVWHGKSRGKTYRSWALMLQRCTNLKAPDYFRYGGRGIRVCERWRDFRNFYADMGERPKGETLDRWPDNDGNYEPGNCRWATHLEQAKNKRPISCGPTRQRWFRAWHKDSMGQYMSNSQNAFAKRWDIDGTSICRHLRSKRKKAYRGWRFEFLEKVNES